MSKHEKCKDKKETVDKLRVRELKVKNGCFQSLKASDINAKNINALSLNTTDFTTINADITNLNVKNINGKDINCNVSFTNFSANIIPVEYENNTPIQPVQPSGSENGFLFNPLVWDGLWNETLFTLNDVLIPNLACGRFRNKLIYDFYCVPNCLPDDYSGCTGPIGPTGATGSTGSGYVNIFGDITGDILTVNIVVSPINEIEIGFTVIGQGIKQNTVITEKLIDNQYRVSIAQNTDPNKKMLLISNCPQTDCSPVPMKIYGQYTIPPGIWDNSCFQTYIASSIVYNLDVINRSINLNTRAVSVLVQIGWIDPITETLRIRQIDLAIRQFTPSLAAFLGEQMAANILLPTELIQEVLTAMPAIFDTNQAAVQLVVYIEDGVEVFVPPIPNAISNAIPKVISKISDKAIPTGNSSGNVSFAFTRGEVQGEILLTINKPTPYIFEIPNKTIWIRGYGGGGGGGSGSIPGGGGGGGSGGDGKIYAISDAKYISFNIGKGGQTDQDGGDTTFSASNARSEIIIGDTVYKGGKSGKGINGGDGFFGGGGAGGDNNLPGNGGTGAIVLNNGFPGIGKNGGNGGANEGQGGAAGNGCGGGGGGGRGGGNGGSSGNVFGDRSANGSDGTMFGAGGGGGNSSLGFTNYFGKGGNGSDGFLLISIIA
jgi:hypothetical protein